MPRRSAFTKTHEIGIFMHSPVQFSRPDQKFLFCTQEAFRLLTIKSPRFISPHQRKCFSLWQLKEGFLMVFGPKSTVTATKLRERSNEDVEQK